MAEGEMSVLLVTANVGSMFEKSTEILPEWTLQFRQLVEHRRPDFVALHMQEVGGKIATDAADLIKKFLQTLDECVELAPFTCIRGYVDEEHSNAQRFTALGSIYFARDTLHDVALWDFAGERFHPVAGREILRENLYENNFHVKEKFPSDFSPHRLTRKGLLVTRWKLNGCLYNFINVHLYHDPSNLVAMEESPSKYAANRHRALLYSLKKLATLAPCEEPVFLFGDFNFRLDLHQLVKNDVIQSYGGTAPLNRLDSEDKALFCASSGDVVLQVGPKVFKVTDKSLFEEKFHLLSPFDRETSDLGLFEQRVTFQPSYPLSEDGLARQYVETRCPAWCDRILYNAIAKEHLDKASPSSVSYDLVGLDSCMGDHKPVYLSFTVAPMPMPASHESLSSASPAEGGGCCSGGGSRPHMLMAGLTLGIGLPLILCKCRLIQPSSTTLLLTLGLNAVGLLALSALYK